MSWLCPTELDQRRAVDTSARVRKARLTGAACAGLGILVLAPLLSWWLVPIFVVSAINLLTIDLRMRRSPHPERTPAFGMVFTELMLAAAVAFTGGPTSVALPWMAVPVVMAAARFRQHVVITGVAIAIVLTIGVGLAVDAHALFAHPELTIVTIGLICTVAAIAVAIQGAEMQHRVESVLDPLTGLLNRKSLLPRFEEIQQQARRADAPVCLIAADLDNFKLVNDRYGHDRGDTVLRETAYEMRKCLRSFELFYRVGGEEFLIVLPGVDLDAGREVAESMRATVERARPAGVDVTVSLGVSVASGEELEFDRLFGAADDALYSAKDAGRNRVATYDVLPPSRPENSKRTSRLSAAMPASF